MCIDITVKFIKGESYFRRAPAQGHGVEFLYGLRC